MKTSSRRERIRRLKDSPSEQQMEIRKQLKLQKQGETTFILPDSPKESQKPPDLTAKSRPSWTKPTNRSLPDPARRIADHQLAGAACESLLEFGHVRNHAVHSILAGRMRVHLCADASRFWLRFSHQICPHPRKNRCCAVNPSRLDGVLPASESISAM